ncbi:MAG TPA: ElyC/SanA/YdcF family protein [Pyrinomonadaceae bacterium]|nr:ElyC/SanA/YdcF family protein [Pyrinomonadaceae bacterium]
MWWRTGLIFLLLFFVVGVIFIYAVNRHVHNSTNRKAQNSITEIPGEDPPRIAIVFGAGVWRNGEPSPVLYDRVLTAVELRRAGRVRKLLMSGDNRVENYNEPQAMKETALKLGVPESDIVLDYAGRNTYDTCFRAKEIFGVERAVLVTQEFHLRRALYLCESFGIESIGITADRRKYETSASQWWAVRENLAVASAWFDLNIRQPTPILGKKESVEP